MTVNVDNIKKRLFTKKILKDMILLNESDYYKVIKPLQLVLINNLFARSVVEKKISGKIYVDDLVKPKTFYVVHPYGMGLLFGDCTNAEFNSNFKEYGLNCNYIRNSYEWMQTFPDEWNDTISKLFGNKLVHSTENTKETGIIELNTRVNFKFDYAKYQSIKKIDDAIFEIKRSDANIYENMPGTVVPKYFWKNADDFLENGIGFSLLYEEHLAATVFSAFIHDDKLELGIETVNEFRKKGLAKIACCAMIDYCIENRYEPIWSCRLENIASYILAQKIGFDPISKTPYYRLSK